MIEVFQIKLYFGSGSSAHILDILNKVGKIWVENPGEKDFLDEISISHNPGFNARLLRSLKTNER